MTGHRTEDLVDSGQRRYVFLEHTLAPSGVFTVDEDSLRSYVVVRGRVKVRRPGSDEAGAVEYGHLAGWHAWGVTFEALSMSAEAAVVLEAGLDDAGLRFPARLSPLSDYTVAKPWGHEIWYTGHDGRVPYVLKQIHMTAGHRSSLQSHRLKAETNYVVDGQVTVLNGTFAPSDAGVDPGVDSGPDPGAIDVAAIPRRACGPGARWTSPPGMLHRVIAQTDYTSIEASTPELDDVVRWQDDTGRGDGRIAAEHPGRQP